LKTTVDRLENILNEYEDALWLLRLAVKTGGNNISNVPEPHTLRKALVEWNMAASMQICNDLFDAGDEYRFGFDNASDLADWYFHSKRIFRISSVLSEMLLATDLPDFSAEGMKWISQAFVIQLEKPVTSSAGRKHDFILCSYCPNTKALSIRSYPKDYEDYQPFGEREKQRVERDAQNKNPGFRNFLDKFTRKTRSRFVTGYTCFLLDTKSCKESIFESAPAEEREDWEIIFQLALGVNLYLQSARQSDSDVEKVTKIQNPHPIAGERKRITTGAELFELSISSTFSSKSEGPPSTKDSGGSVRPHFRRGYWRRPSGFGNDPTAFATIWVRPTWVRKDRIQEGESPTGSLQSIT
jgi:hypothetical protein